MPHVGLKPCLFGALADDEESEIPKAGVEESFLQVREEVNVLLNRQSPDVPDHETVILAEAACRVE
jgi:hypothetical protein